MSALCGMPSWKAWASSSDLIPAQPCNDLTRSSGSDSNPHCWGYRAFIQNSGIPPNQGTVPWQHQGSLQMLFILPR